LMSSGSEKPVESLVTRLAAHAYQATNEAMMPNAPAVRRNAVRGEW